MNNESLKGILKECLDDAGEINTIGERSNSILSKLAGRLEALLMIIEVEEEQNDRS